MSRLRNCMAKSMQELQSIADSILGVLDPPQLMRYLLWLEMNRNRLLESQLLSALSSEHAHAKSSVDGGVAEMDTAAIAKVVQKRASELGMDEVRKLMLFVGMDKAVRSPRLGKPESLHPTAGHLAHSEGPLSS